MPPLVGRAIVVCDAARLTACNGKLFFGRTNGGRPVHAASFVRARKIVLDTALLRRPHLLRSILLHEIFHFVWVRLGNRKRWEFAAILHRELRNHAGGEIGESSGVQKERLLKHGRVSASRAWRDYVCEAFCDTAAWLYAGGTASSPDLAARWRGYRERWFQATFHEEYRC
jgi:hypothetical protein